MGGDNGTSYEAVQAISYGIEIVFFWNMVLHFFTAFIDKASNEEVTSHRRICMHYLKGSFVLDLIAVLPFDKMLSQGGTASA